MKIGIFTPSSAVSPYRLQQSIVHAEKMGHSLVFANSPSANYGSSKFLFSADSKEGRIEAFKQLLIDPEIDLIMCARGSYGALELLPDLYNLKEEVTKNFISKRKIISGLSDFTVFLTVFDNIPSLNFIHGPGFVDAFFEVDSDLERRQNWLALQSLVEGSWNGYDSLPLEQFAGGKIDGQLEANFIGGNLSVLASLVGGLSVDQFVGRGLFIEETGEKPYKVHRSLLQLKNAGLLNKLRVVVLGDFSNCEHEKGLGPNVEEVLRDIFKDARYPVLKGYPGGHTARNLPLPLNRRLELRCNQDRVVHSIKPLTLHF